MKRIIFIVFIVFLPVNIAYADNFQIIDRSSGFYVAYSPVYINEELIGYTDKYGRIAIDLSTGEYRSKVIYKKQDISFTLIIDGSESLKEIYVE